MGQFNQTAFSVIIPTFNRDYCLERAIYSVLNQNYNNFEIIIVDDGSNDKTSSKIYKIKLQFPDIVTIITIPNSGVSKARNIGVKFSDFEWVCFLDSDDEWLKNKLYYTDKYIKEQPNISLWHSDEKWIRNGNFVNKKKIHQKKEGNVFIYCLDLCFISPSTVCIKKKLFESLNGFNESYPVCEDYDLWLRITLNHKVGLINRPLIKKYGGHEDQLSTRFKAMDYYRIKSMFNLLKNSKMDTIQKNSLKTTLKKKINVLSIGYKKYNNLEKLDELNAISEFLK